MEKYKKKYLKNFVPPAPGDAGGAIGSSLIYLKKFKSELFKNLENPYLGPSYSNEEINKIISKNNLINKYQIEYYNDNELTKKSCNYFIRRR